jgi:hypothetical protein
MNERTIILFSKKKDVYEVIKGYSQFKDVTITKFEDIIMSNISLEILLSGFEDGNYMLTGILSKADKGLIYEIKLNMEIFDLEEKIKQLNVEYDD